MGSIGRNSTDWTTSASPWGIEGRTHQRTIRIHQPYDTTCMVEREARQDAAAVESSQERNMLEGKYAPGNKGPQKIF